jgi:uncharacterized membrane protein
MLAFYGPLQFTSALLAVLAAAASAWAGDRSRSFAVVAAVLAVAVFVPYVLYFQKANAAFAAATIAVDQVPAELTRWAMWQWVRATVGVAAFIASVLALRRSA